VRDFDTSGQKNISLSIYATEIPQEETSEEDVDGAEENEA